MADYGKIAAEEKARHDALRHAATVELKQREAAVAFFKQVETALGAEINKANPELEKYGLLKGARKEGLVLPAKRFATQIRLTYGRNIYCEVNYDESQTMIHLELNVEPEMSGEPLVHRAAFRVRSSDSGAAARKVESGEETAGELSAEDIAETVVVGMIRGQLD